MLSDEQMINGWPFSLLNDEQMSNKVRVEQQADFQWCFFFYLAGQLIYTAFCLFFLGGWKRENWQSFLWTCFFFFVSMIFVGGQLDSVEPKTSDLPYFFRWKKQHCQFWDASPRPPPPPKNPKIGMDGWLSFERDWLQVPFAGRFQECICVYDVYDVYIYTYCMCIYIWGWFTRILLILYTLIT